MINTEDLNKGDVALIGIPFDEKSSFLRGTAKGPKEILKALHSDSANLSTEGIKDLKEINKWKEVGIIEVKDYLNDITNGIIKVLDKKSLPFSLGGDHSITYPILKAIGKKYPNLTIIHLDAHSDLYDSFDGDRYSHACPFARIMEEGLAKKLIQIGIRTLTPHQNEQAAKFGVRIIPAWETDFKTGEIAGPVYLSLDLDVLDPAFAPGISHYEPGGLSPRQVVEIIKQIPGTLIGADIVELNPERDVNGVTAMVAAKFLKEIIARILGL